MCVLLPSDGAIVRNKGSEFVVLHEFFFFPHKLTSQDYVYLFFPVVVALE